MGFTYDLTTYDVDDGFVTVEYGSSPAASMAYPTPPSAPVRHGPIPGVNWDSPALAKYRAFVTEAEAAEACGDSSKAIAQHYAAVAALKHLMGTGIATVEQHALITPVAAYIDTHLSRVDMIRMAKNHMPTVTVTPPPRPKSRPHPIDIASEGLSLGKYHEETADYGTALDGYLLAADALNKCLKDMKSVDPATRQAGSARQRHEVRDNITAAIVGAARCRHVLYMKEGACCEIQGDVDAAREAYAKAVDVLEAVTPASPEEPLEQDMLDDFADRIATAAAALRRLQ